MTLKCFPAELLKMEYIKMYKRIKNILKLFQKCSICSILFVLYMYMNLASYELRKKVLDSICKLVIFSYIFRLIVSNKIYSCKLYLANF